MGSKTLAILSLLLLPLSLGAQTAADYLNRSAQKYVFGDEEAARADIEEAERKFPNDPAIKDLSELLHKKKPPQNQNDQNQNQKQNQNQQNQQQQNSGGGGSSNQQQQSKNNKNQSPTPTPTPTPSASPSPNENSPTPTPGESSTPTPTPGDQQGNSPTPSPGEGETPTPTPGDEGSGNSPTPSPSPNDNGGKNGEPSATPAGTPEKPLTGDVKSAGEENPKEKQAAEIAEAEPEKEGEMSPKQAQLLLESMKDEEQKVQLDEHKTVRPVYKDW